MAPLHHIFNLLGMARTRALSLALQQHPDRTARPVWVFPKFDKLSAAWILTLPKPDTFLSGSVFQESMAWHLCLPSPACKNLVGKEVGNNGTMVDVWGEKVMCAKLPFDTWRVRHDTIKHALVSCANEARVGCEAEVYGLFRDLIPVQAMEEGGRLETVRQRSGVVPDLRLQLHPAPGPGRSAGQVEIRGSQGMVATDTLAELKVLSAGVSHYPRGSRVKAVDRRAAALHGMYRGKLAALDQQYYGTRQGEIGPLEHRLESRWGEVQGLVVGQFGEASLPLHALIKAIAWSRAMYVARARGKPATETESGMMLSHYRRILSTTFVRSQAVCLLSRLGHLGSGARAAAQTCITTMRQEEVARMEIRAYYQAYIQGRR